MSSKLPRAAACAPASAESIRVPKRRTGSVGHSVGPRLHYRLLTLCPGAYVCVHTRRRGHPGHRVSRPRGRGGRGTVVCECEKSADVSLYVSFCVCVCVGGGGSRSLSPCYFVFFFRHTPRANVFTLRHIRDRSIRTCMGHDTYLGHNYQDTYGT